jgi:hypothetical protein
MNQKEFERMKQDCKEKMKDLLKQARQSSKLLESIKHYPASTEERELILEQRAREHEALAAYQETRNRLFQMAGWGLDNESSSC